ncbi:MAG: hypothetical protein DME25_13860, partial [Verrucomicrobia bacterium]
MDADEREICLFLKSWQHQFVSAREIARRAGGKWRFREDPNWALPVLGRLVERGLVETDANAHYRLKPQHKKEKKKWVSPQIKRLLEESGKKFEETIEVDELD